MVSVENIFICGAANFSPLDTCTRIRYDRESVLFLFYYYMYSRTSMARIPLEP